MGCLLDKVISWTPKVIFLALFTYFISKVIVAVGKPQEAWRIKVLKMSSQDF